jgi:ABC-type Zn uptake system ZnuABC Zn-binding protein ZnuA
VAELLKQEPGSMKNRLWTLFGSMVLGATACFAELNVLCTTFPIHQIARNVAQGREGVDLQLMLPAGMGCPHDYALTPQDMLKLAAADVLVVNGLGLEEFLGAPVLAANPGIETVDSSAGIPDLLAYARRPHEADEDHDYEAGADHGRDGVNPHLFASPRQTARIALNIAGGLSKADPEGAGVYSRNAQAYAARMNALADEMAAFGQTLQNNRIVEPHGVFDYLARDMGLEIVAVLRPHGQEPSAAEMLELVRDIRAKQAGAIFTEPQYPAKVGEALARETGLPVALLDPAATGPGDAPLEHFETVMRKNMEVLGATLGVKP